MFKKTVITLYFDKILQLMHQSGGKMQDCWAKDPRFDSGPMQLFFFFLFFKGSSTKRQKAMEYKVTWVYVIVKNAGFVSERFLMNLILLFHYNWAATWQNQQSEYASSEDSDQPWHPPSLIRVFAVRSVGSQGFFMTQISLGIAGRTLIVLVLSCRGSSLFSHDL